MGESIITEKDLLDRGYTQIKGENKYTKTINGKDIELVPNGKGVLPKVKHNNSKISIPYIQVDTPDKLDELEDYIKSN